jgi:hypothetical protein
LLSQLELLGHLPRALNIVGYGRSKVVLADFLEKQCVNVKEQPGLPKEEFMVSSIKRRNERATCGDGDGSGLTMCCRIAGSDLVSHGAV